LFDGFIKETCALHSFTVLNELKVSTCIKIKSWVTTMVVLFRVCGVGYTDGI